MLPSSVVQVSELFHQLTLCYIGVRTNISKPLPHFPSLPAFHLLFLHLHPFKINSSFGSLFLDYNFTLILLSLCSMSSHPILITATLHTMTPMVRADWLRLSSLLFICLAIHRALQASWQSYTVCYHLSWRRCWRQLQCSPRCFPNSAPDPSIMMK